MKSELYNKQSCNDFKIVMITILDWEKGGKNSEFSDNLPVELSEYLPV